MADNFNVLDGAGASLTKASKDIGSGVQADKVFVVDGHDEAQGAKADAAATTDAGTFSVVALLKRLMATYLSALWKAEDAAHASGDQGVMALVVRKDTAAALAGTDGDYAPLEVDATGRLHVAAGATENHVGEVGGRVASVVATFARPADTTAYAAGDVVSNNTTTTTPMTLTNFARVSGGSGYITGARLSTDKKSITPRIRVHLFSASNATLSADNAAYRELYADSSKRLGYFDLPAMTTGTDTTNSDMSRAIDLNLRIPFVAVGSRDIYAVLEALDAFTPASGQNFSLTLTGDLD